MFKRGGLPIYFIRSHYPELKDIPKPLRRHLIKRVCDNPMTRSRLTKRVWEVGSATAFVLFIFCLVVIRDEMVAMLTFAMCMLPAVLITGLVKIGEDRKIFITWLTKNSQNGRPHYCLKCWQPLPNAKEENCPYCSEQLYLLVTTHSGTPPPIAAVKEELQEYVLPALDLPSKFQRDSISQFLQGKEHTGTAIWGCLTQLMAYIVMFGSAITVYMMYSDTPLRWLVLFADIFLIIFFLWVAYKAIRSTPASVKAKIKKCCPDGVAPWCIYCDYDLRGSAKQSCPECGKPVFVYDFKWRPWKKKRARPLK